MSPGGVANLVAWAVLAGLVAVAVVLVVILGPFGLVLLGLLTLFVCSQFSLDEHAPTWGHSVFRARLTDAVSLRKQAAVAANQQAALSPVRLRRLRGLFAHRRCGRPGLAVLALSNAHRRIA